MYIIQFEEGVYASRGKGDPARTLKIENAKRFSCELDANNTLSKIINEIKYFRRFTNPLIRWVDEVDLTLKP